MAIEKIILGDDHLDFAKRAMPYIPDSTIDYVDNPAEIVSRVEIARADGLEPYTMIISDFDYGEGWMNGIDMFRSLVGRGYATEARKILWTGNADEPGIRRQAKELEVEVLDKDQLGAIVGLSVSKAPLKKDGRVMIYVQRAEGPIYNSMRQVVETVFQKGTIDLRGDLKKALMENQYGLVLDSTTMMHPQGHGSVAHDMKYMELPAVPAVVCLRNPSTFLADAANAIFKFYDMQKYEKIENWCKSSEAIIRFGEEVLHRAREYGPSGQGSYASAMYNQVFSLDGSSPAWETDCQTLDTRLAQAREALPDVSWQNERKKAEQLETMLRDLSGAIKIVHLKYIERPHNFPDVMQDERVGVVK